MELLKQPLYHSMNLQEQVLTLFLASKKQFLTIEKHRVKEYQKALLAYFEEERNDIVREIEESKDLSQELQDQILKAAEHFKIKSGWE